MKSKRIFWCLMASLLLVCCRDGASDVLLHHMSMIEQHGDSNPQQALEEVREIERDIDNCRSAYVRNKYLLLRTRLCDKAYLIPNSSDTIDSVVEYFMKEGSNQERMEARYYQGSVYRDLKDYPRAIASFLDVLDIAEKSKAGPCRLLQNTYSQLSNLYFQQMVYGKALEMAQAGLDMARSTNTLDPVYIMDVSSAALLCGDTAEAIRCCREAVEYVKLDSLNACPDVICEILIRFSEGGMKSDAQECLSVLRNSNDGVTAKNYLPAMASYFESISLIDSAMLVNQKIISESSVLSQKLKAVQKLMLYCFQTGDYEEGAKYAMMYDEYVESVFEENQYEQTSRACGEHLYAVSLKKEMAAREETAAKQKRIYILMGVFLLSALAGSVAYGRRKKRFARVLVSKDLELAQSRDVIRQYDVRLAESVALAESQKRRLADMETEMVQTERELKRMEEEKAQFVESQKKKMEVLNRTIAENEVILVEKQRQIKELVKLTLLEKASIDSGDVVQKFRDASVGKETISDKDWRSLATAIESMYPGFSEAVLAMPRNTDLSIRTAYLLKLGMSNPQIANLTNCPRQSVWNRVVKVKRCLGKLLS